ncbi:MAG: hypothetical protein M1817_002990 [Caeruleum heppii]|nr:MAG: hypothetical protein M1817_002990 [Caeruleum heppii]
MTLPPPQPPPPQQDSTASGKENVSSRRSAAIQQQAAGPSPLRSSNRRLVLKPISTGSGSPSSGSPSRGDSQPSPRHPSSGASPFTPSSKLSDLDQWVGRARPSTANSKEPPSSSQLSPRSRSQFPPASSATTSTTASQGGGGGGSSSGGGHSRQPTSYAPTLSQSNSNVPSSPSFPPTQTPSSLTNAGSNLQAGQLSKIVIAQVFLLLMTIKEDKDKTKWDAQADQIRKLIDSNGMDVFTKYFKRLLSGNASLIFPGINRPVENAPNYPLLVGEMRKLSQDPDQARKIAEAIATPDGDLFKDFDISTFMEHFKLDALEKTVLASGFKSISRADLRTKADAILANNFLRFLEVLSTSSISGVKKHGELPTSILTTLIENLARSPPPNFNDEAKARLVFAVRLHYENQDMQVPVSVALAAQLIDLYDAKRQPLVRTLHRAGPHGTSSLDACRDLLQSASNQPLEPHQVAGALLYMIATESWQQYTPAVFITVIREHSQAARLDWNAVVRGFDRDGLSIDRERFLVLYNSLLPVAVDLASFDIQMLWGGSWQWPETQISFVQAFLMLAPSDMDASTIPRLRRTILPEDFADAPEGIKAAASTAFKHPLISLDATAALCDYMFNNSGTVTSPDAQRMFQQLVQSSADAFICSAIGIPKPWSETQQGIFSQIFFPFLAKQHPNHAFVLHSLWRLDKQWVATRLVEAHAQEPLKLPILFEHAQEHHWLDDLLMILNIFGIDLAAFAHRKGALDLEKWAQTNAQRSPQDFAFALSRFLTIKAEDEMQTVRKEQQFPRTVSLAVKTVNTMLDILEDGLAETRREDLVAVQRLCIQAYPRLINYGEGFDEVIDANGEESNAIPESADAMMQEHYKKMYSGERDVRDIVGALKGFKRSSDPAEQDLFACMIHGLFDEYSCYHEYPLEALATTAVLFGGIINFNLISGIPLRVGLGMILEAVRDYSPETSMYKFGLQALLHFFNRLQEWPGFCSLLLQVPGLRGTEALAKAEEVVRERAGQSQPEVESDLLRPRNGFSDGGLANGTDQERFPTDTTAQRFAFSSLHVDLPSTDASEEPSEDVQDKVLFVLNNVSEQNLEVKLKDLRDALREEHHLWFASYLVEQRAKMQPNYHNLYLDMLDLLANNPLWGDVLRETYASAIRMLNAQSSMESSTERSLLKNLGAWLGRLTIARDKPILFRNISFKDLLIEAYDSQRLLVVIPFVCKVLAQAAKSRVFRPPNPWTMDVLGLLVELYHCAELRLQLKFEVEVLCKDLDLDHTAIEPSSNLRERPMPDDNLSGSILPDGLEGFDDLSIAGLARAGARNERFSSGTITSALPDVGSMLVYPPTSNTTINRESLRYIVENAVRKAIQEIISPVVERSVTIAAISTAQLIQKDFAMEANEDRVRQSALTMVKALAGSLALVTCKEPLRMSMTNNIRVLSAQVGDQGLPEGAILMCVNDNLDTACGLVESAAERSSMPEIEENIEQQLLARRRHRAAHPNEPFVDPIVNRWAFYIPEPYKQSQAGLNNEQMAIYEDFARQSRGPSNHANAPSTDSGRQIAGDVLQDQFPAIPSLPTPAEPPALPHQTPQQGQQRIQPPPSMPTHLTPTPHLNGFIESKTTNEQIHELLLDLQRVLEEAPEEHLRELSATSAAVEVLDQILRLLMTSTQREETAYISSKQICHMLFSPEQKSLKVEVFVQLLKQLCDTSHVAAREVTLWLVNQEDDRAFNVPVTVTLLEAGLLEIHHVDATITKAVQQRKPEAVEFLHALMNEILFVERPLALRADFANSLEAVAQWLAEEPDLNPAKELIWHLRQAGMPEGLDTAPDELSRLHRDQLEYGFAEWVRLCSLSSTTPKSFAAFIAQLHQKQLMDTQEDSCLFFRLCIEASVDAFEQADEDAGLSPSQGFVCIDALAKLIIYLVHYQGEAEAEQHPTKAAYLDSILSLIVLVMNHHHVMRGDRFNQKVFFRLFSSVLCEHHALGRQAPQQEEETMLVFAHTFLTLQPLLFPGFVFGWLSLVSHRFFMPIMLLLSNQAGWSSYTALMEALFAFIGELLKALTVANGTKDLYRGTLRILLILHHDFPEFLVENHYRLCNALPAHCTQLRNLILSAYPSSFPELPDPFTAGLKVDRINEIRKSPVITGDFEEALLRSGLKETVDAALKSGPSDDHIARMCAVLGQPIKTETGVGFAPIQLDIEVMGALVLYVGISAITAVSQKGGPTFVQNAPQAALLDRLAHELHPEARYYFLSAIANQLRYPNSHTHYFSYALLFLFGSDQNDPQESDVRQQITRVLLERLIVHRPHPWGLIITLLELLKNPSYLFWDLPFIKAAPEIERLFGALFQHINQTPR